MFKLSLLGLCSAPLIITSLFIYPDFLYYYIILDSWSILRLSSEAIAGTFLSYNTIIISALIIVLCYQKKTIIPNQRKLYIIAPLSLLLWILVSYYYYTHSINTNAVNNIVFIYLSLIFLKDGAPEKLALIAVVALLASLALSSTMIANNLITGSIGQRSYAGNRIHSAFYALEGGFLLFYLREWKPFSVLVRCLINLVIMIIYLSVFLSLGRMVTLIACVSLLFFLYKGYVHYLTGSAAIVFAIFLVMLFPKNISTFLDKLTRLPNSQHTNIASYNDSEMGAFTSGRSAAYNVAWKLYKTKPVFGIGYDRWATDINKGSPGSSLHSRWLQILLETGAVGALLYLFLYVTSFARLGLISMLLAREKSPMRDVLFMSLLGFLLIGITDNHGYTDRIFFMIVAFIASYPVSKQ